MKNYDFMPKESLESYADGQVRHKPGAEDTDFLAHWLKVLRPVAYASKGESWGEMEKLFSIFFVQAVLGTRHVRAIFGHSDMRDISPKMIKTVQDLMSAHLIRCDECQIDAPGVWKNFVNSDYPECPKCQGTNFVKKQMEAIADAGL